MSRENVDLTYRMRTTMNERDFSGFLALMHPDVEITPYIAAMEGRGPYRGLDGVRSWLEDAILVLPNLSFEIE
jgi:SnoaL-like domain